ncbi:MAG: rod shape-determining protein MreD [Bacteroidaceae bacterium]|nr:rod shape-determining protein MreD [Bacteroidaceae bacterium]
MIQTILSRIGWFLLLISLQVFVLNHIHMLGYATPMPYVYFLLILPNNLSRWVWVALGFFLGLIIDVFTNTPGVASASLCATGLLVPFLLKTFTPTDKEEEVFIPSSRTLGRMRFLSFAALSSLVNTTLYFVIELFSFYNWASLLIGIVGSWVLTLLFIIALESLRSAAKKK